MAVLLEHSFHFFSVFKAFRANTLSHTHTLPLFIFELQSPPLFQHRIVKGTDMKVTWIILFGCREDLLQTSTFSTVRNIVCFNIMDSHPMTPCYRYIW